MNGLRLHSRMLIRSILLVVFAAMPLATQAADLLSESRARAKAIAILKGDPYGKTARDVTLNLGESRLIMRGETMCAGTKSRTPVWQFHVVVPASRNPSGGTTIDGYLLLDARTGKLTCAGLPFLGG